MYKLIILLVTFTIVKSTAQNTNKKSVENNLNEYAELASSFLKEQNAESIGGLLSNLVQSDGGKQLSDMLMNMGNNNNANQILQGIGSIISQGSGSKGGFDPEMIGNVLNVLSSLDTGSKKEKNEDGDGDLLSLLGTIMGQEGGLNNVMSFLPMLLSTVESFTGDDAQKRVADHSGHEWLLPPVIEKIHLAYDHFINSELGKSITKSIATQKFVKVFADADGYFSFEKFVELLENHSFRKHWIEQVTRRIALGISYFADPKTQKKFMTTGQYFFNSFLKTQGYPKGAMFDPLRPSETLSHFINYTFKKYLSYKVNAKQYVKPAIEYVQELFRLAQNQGFFTGRGIDSTELSHKLADTINLEVIEPVARVYRAYRFAKKNPKCDRYVMCLVNEHRSDDTISLPGLKNALSKSSSLFASWFLSPHTGTSFWDLYHTIIEEDNCKTRFLQSCNDFHVEEIKVTTEYVHNEL